MHADSYVIRFRDYAGWLAVCAVALALVFAAQQVARSGEPPGRREWTMALALNGLDWLVWASCVPFIVNVGQRARRGAGRSRFLTVVVWIALGAVSIVVVSLVTAMAVREWPEVFAPRLAQHAAPLGRYLTEWTVAMIPLNMLIFAMVAGGLHAMFYHRDLQARRVHETELAARLTRSELNVLRMQLHPHFLFNALHTVSSLTITDVPAAQRVIAAVGTLLRASLDHTARQEVPLRDELSFLRLYLEVQEARFRHRLTIHIQAGSDVDDALVPSFVLQPLVENAVRHGVEPSPSGGTIWIRAERRGEDLEIEVRDEARATRPAGRPPVQPTVNAGIGLANIEARLTQLYGARCRFSAGRGRDGRFTVSMTIPFHTQDGLFPSLNGTQ